METKFSFCQQSPTIPGTANDRNDHDRWDRIRVYLCDRSDRSDRNHCNDPSDHMEIEDLNDPSDYMEIKLQQL